METASVHAVLGFDERSILHCVLYLLSRGFRVGRVVLYTPEALEEQAKRRSEQAFSTIKGLLEPSLNISVSRVSLDPRNLLHNLAIIRREVARDLGEGRIIYANLSSGMRLCILALFTALLSQPRDILERVWVWVEPEGRPEERIVFNLGKLIDILEILRGGDIEAKLLELLAVKGGGSLSELTRFAKEEGVPASRSTIYRYLKKLVEKGVVTEEGGVYKPSLRIEP